MNAIIVCVDYWDYLQITLPYNRHHFNQVMIVTTPEDKRTTEVGIKNKCIVYHTNSFYDDGAAFNKWKALEEGIRHMRNPHTNAHVGGTDFWLTIMDADVLWPKKLPQEFKMQKGCIYGPHRHMLHEFNGYVPQEKDWKKYPIGRDHMIAGFTMLFHIHDPVLRQEEVWFEQDWTHAGGADTYFQWKWDGLYRIRTDWNVLHLGPCGRNWCGRSVAYLDGSLPEKKQEAEAAFRKLMQIRRNTKGANDYAAERIKK